MDAALLEKYLKVKALALRGAAGEKENAAKILAKMETEHPGIARQAAIWAKKQESVEDEPEPAKPKKPKRESGPSGVWQKEEPEQWGYPHEDRPGNWENIFRYAQAAFNGVYGFAENVAQAQMGRELGKQVETDTKMSKAGNLLVALKIPLTVFNKAAQLNTMQKSAFRQMLHEKLDEQLNTLLGEV